MSLRLAICDLREMAEEILKADEKNWRMGEFAIAIRLSGLSEVSLIIPPQPRTGNHEGCHDNDGQAVAGLLGMIQREACDLRC
jgi:hypothetical protein